MTKTISNQEKVFTTHKEVVEHVWSLPRDFANRDNRNIIFYIDTKLYKKYSEYSKTSNPEMVKFCIDFNLSLGYVLHKNKHPVTMNYYNSDSELESESESEDNENESDITPLLMSFNNWSEC